MRKLEILIVEKEWCMNKSHILVDGKLHAQCSRTTLQLLPLLCFRPHLVIACHWIQRDWLPLVIYLLMGTALKYADYYWMCFFLTRVDFLLCRKTNHFWDFSRYCSKHFNTLMTPAGLNSTLRVNILGFGHNFFQVA